MWNNKKSVLFDKARFKIDLRFGWTYISYVANAVFWFGNCSLESNVCFNLWFLRVDWYMFDVISLCVTVQGRPIVWLKQCLRKTISKKLLYSTANLQKEIHSVSWYSVLRYLRLVSRSHFEGLSLGSVSDEPDSGFLSRDLLFSNFYDVTLVNFKLHCSWWINAVIWQITFTVSTLETVSSALCVRHPENRDISPSYF